jgi:hypothetical protein
VDFPPEAVAISGSEFGRVFGRRDYSQSQAKNRAFRARQYSRGFFERYFGETLIKNELLNQGAMD